MEKFQGLQQVSGPLEEAGLFGRSGAPWLCFQHQQNFSADDLEIILARSLGVGYAIPSVSLGSSPHPVHRTGLLFWRLRCVRSDPEVCGCLAQPENLLHTKAKGGMATSGREQGSRVWVGADGCSNLPHFLVSGAICF